MNKIIVICCLFIGQFTFSQNEYTLAEKYYYEGAYEKALQYYKSLFNKNQYNSSYLKKLITCYQETNQFTESENILKNLLQKNPKLGHLYVELGFNYQKQQQIALAKSNYQKALDAINETQYSGRLIANYFKQNGLIDYALIAFEKVKKENPTWNYEVDIAKLYGEKGDFEKMFQSYLDLIDKDDSYLNSVLHLLSEYISDDSQDSNNKIFKNLLIKKTISNPKNQWNQLLSWLFVKQKDYNKAFIQEKALFQRDPNFIMNIKTLAAICFENSEYETAKAAYQLIEKESSINELKIDALFYLLKIDIASNEKDIDKKFKKIYQQFGVNALSLKIQIEEADYLTFIKHQPEEAITILEKSLSFTTNKFEQAAIKLKLGDIHVFKNEFNRALIYFSQIQTSIKNHTLAQEARFKVAQTSYFKNDFKWAMAQLKVLKGSTTQLIANDALELFLLISNNKSKDSLPNGLEAYATADLLAYQQKNDEAIKSLSDILIKYKGQSIEAQALYKQATLFSKQKKYQNAIDNYLHIIDLDPKGLLVDDAIFQIAEIYNKQINNTEKASDYYQKIIFEHPSSIYLVDARKKYRILRGDAVN